jgi:UPF0176 protein
MNSSESTIILFYLYTHITDPENLREREKSVCEVLDLKGRLLIASEGVNGTLEGTPENIAKYKAHILSDKRFRHMNIKESVGTGSAFPKLAVKVKDEIVSTKLPKNIDPRKATGKHLNPAELKKWYEEDEDFVVFDMRNDYEIASGYFEKTVNVESEMKASRDLPEIMKKFDHLKDKKVLTVCTGGVRCEKMSAYLLDQGFKDVYQLHNGMHAYMEKYPGQDFKGTLYTFDNRMTMDFGGERQMVGKCYVCKNTTENYGHCAFPLCHAHLLICADCSKEKQFCNEVCKDKLESSLSVK